MLRGLMSSLRESLIRIQNGAVGRTLMSVCFTFFFADSNRPSYARWMFRSVPQSTQKDCFCFIFHSFLLCSAPSFTHQTYVWDFEHRLKKSMEKMYYVCFSKTGKWVQRRYLINIVSFFSVFIPFMSCCGEEVIEQI